MKFIKMANGNYVKAEAIGAVTIEDNSGAIERTREIYKVYVIQEYTGAKYLYGKVFTREDAEKAARAILQEIGADYR